MLKWVRKPHNSKFRCSIFDVSDKVQGLPLVVNDRPANLNISYSPFLPFQGTPHAQKYRKLLCASTSGFICLFLPAILFAQTADTRIPMFRHDLQHTGRSPYVSAQKPTIKWTFKTEGPVTTSPAIGSDGTISLRFEGQKAVCGY